MPVFMHNSPLLCSSELVNLLLKVSLKIFMERCDTRVPTCTTHIYGNDAPRRSRSTPLAIQVYLKRT